MSWGIFEVFGIEIEHMIVDATSLDVKPCSDVVLIGPDGSIASEVEHGEIAWSNELVMHVIEMKTNGPVASLSGLGAVFQKNVLAIEAGLREHGARLMPTAMHPWMSPADETKLWPHESAAVYEAFDRIFDCRGHGWSNLQSMHINLPYRGDDELARLHTAIRLVLPLLPALAASSPVADGALTGLADTRLSHYRSNCASMPSVTGHVVPEQVSDEAAYREVVLGPIARDIASHDPDGILDPEWVNARGAIARLSRGSIEIRVLDTQEHPAADIAIAELVVAVVRALVEERWVSFERQTKLHEVALEEVFLSAMRDGGSAIVEDAALLTCFGMPSPATAMGVWRRLAGSVLSEAAEPLAVILEHGTLSERIVRALGGQMARLPAVYLELCECLRGGRSFMP